MNTESKVIRSLTRALWLGVVMSLLADLAMAAGVVARVDRDKIVEGETITLVLQTDDPQQSLKADLGPLENDFVILDQRSESQMSIVNGRQAATIRLMVTLEPRRSGTLMIPALSLEGATTSPIRVSVEPAPDLAPGELPPVFIELELEPRDGPYYVHAQLSMTVRIFYQQNLTEAAINPPSPELASVRLLDEVPYQSTRNEVRYRVLERRYAVFPERSGELVIPPMTLSGRLIERPADRLWQPSVRGRRVQVESDPLVIQVLPKPADYPGDHWLPARRITLSQQITDADKLQVGEPVTRTVILDAVGLEENMLEEPAWPEMPDARIYPDQPQGISRDDGQWVLGHKEFRYAVVPEKPGELVLPEIRLDWFDTSSGEVKSAVLPEHRVAVAESPLAAQYANRTPVLSEGADGSAYSGRGGTSDGWWRNIAFLLGALWLVTLILYIRKGPVKDQGADRAAAVSVDESALLDAFRKACKSGDSTAARSALGRWMRHYGPPAARGSLMEFARQCGEPALKSEIHRFDAGAFSDRDGGGWDGGELWRLFSAWLGNRDRRDREESDELDLYARGKAAPGRA